MSRPKPRSSGQVHPAVALAFGVIAVVGLVAAVTVGRGSPGAPVATPAPSATPGVTVAPSLSPATPTAIPATPAPTQAAHGDDRISLDVADEHSVVVGLQDADGLLASARTGRAADGMSVRWHDVDVVQVGDSSVRLTWVGMAVNEQVDVVVARNGSSVAITIVQAGPAENSDALGADRVLVLSFADDVDASKIVTEVLDRTVD